MAREKELPQFLDEYAADMIFDSFKSKSSREFQFDPRGKKYIIPLAGNEASQEIEIATNEKQYDAILGKWEYSYYRIEEPVKIRGEKEFVVGKPVLLEHSPKRKSSSEYPSRCSKLASYEGAKLRLIAQYHEVLL